MLKSIAVGARAGGDSCFDCYPYWSYTPNMATQLPANEFDAFYAFLSSLRSSDVAPVSPEESVQKFRESQELLRRFQQLNEVASNQSRQGLSKPLDLESLLDRVERRVAQGQSQ